LAGAIFYGEDEEGDGADRCDGGCHIDRRRNIAVRSRTRLHLLSKLQARPAYPSIWTRRIAQVNNESAAPGRMLR
jgi:hypothetical protein